MKKIINSVENIVSEMCQGIVLANPSLELDLHNRIIYRKNTKKDKVTLISGGGSGHEPAHAGYVGEGLLDAAVCGDVFASPTQVQVYQAIRKVQNAAGSLLIIKNYSGDIMNFQSAQMMADDDGIIVDSVKVDDDIAVQNSLYTVGRRGVAGTVFVHKVAGAAAEEGLPLSEVKRLAQKTADSVKSIGFALNSCTVPTKGTPTFDLGQNEIEYGVGIHGEPGISRESIQNSQTLVQKMMLAINLELKLSSENEVAILVNGFGATPLMELYIVYYDVAKWFAEKGITIRYALVGNYMTSIDMAGASLSILKIDDELLHFLSAPCDAPGFKQTTYIMPEPFDLSLQSKQKTNQSNYLRETNPSLAIINGQFSAQNMIYLIDCMAEIIIKNEVYFCELDAHAGDGDFGMSLAKGFKELKHRFEELSCIDNNIGLFLEEISLILMAYCGGASGPIWGAAFRSAGKSIGAKSFITISDFANMMQAMVEGIQLTGKRSFGRGAEIGDKTLIDALIPASESWHFSANNNHSWRTAFEKAAKAAVEGAKNTESFAAKMGRAGTAGERSIGFPDAGAHALGIIFTELSTMMTFND
ncbi:dihydroxyacetone kinase subunit DhaK [Thorsellia anophelis]|uniref:Homodimeric dihydroxyacetone kinase n=1 Tax=Thorsellia anophelis DSM 18579 TaxID=1123402 RepID=A0A1I0D1D3_9GAMM|nr:dihydroxyacetone kinase subunit DhaK [Thorsellia anophelis]SET25885.1 homodimeric dihydroxyacetone kinase [Thorsellia anophelis DSM 18579]